MMVHRYCSCKAKRKGLVEMLTKFVIWIVALLLFVSTMVITGCEEEGFDEFGKQCEGVDYGDDQQHGSITFVIDPYDNKCGSGVCLTHVSEEPDGWVVDAYCTCRCADPFDSGSDDDLCVCPEGSICTFVAPSSAADEIQGSYCLEM